MNNNIPIFKRVSYSQLYGKHGESSAFDVP